MRFRGFKTGFQRSFFLIGLLCSSLNAPFKLTAGGRAYKVDFRGIENPSQIRSLKDSSNLVRYRKTFPRSMAALQYRANSDTSSFLDILNAYGYYDACVSNKTFRLPSGKYKIVISIDRGARYQLSKFQIKLKDPDQVEPPFLIKLHLRELDIRLKKPILSVNIVDAEKKLIEDFTNNGYPLAKITSEDILVDQAQKKVGVELKVESGPKAYFGKTSLETESNIKSKFIRNRIKWKSGELYSSETVKRTEKALYNTGLFSVVSITPGSELSSSDEIQMTIQLIDSKHNGFTIGGSYTTVWEGLGGQATWQTRNIFSTGTDLKLNYQINQKLQEAGLKYTFPDFLSPHQVIVLSSNISNDEQPNYTEKAVKTDLFVERILSTHFKTSLGVRFDQLESTKSDLNGFFSLFGIPFNFNTQSSEKVLINPTSGGWANLSFAPYFSLNNDGTDFSEVKIEASIYQFLIPSKRVVLAMNMVFGSLFGGSDFEIPTPYRYFAGSPNHLRGYPYQEVSPLDGRGRPIGGRSMFLWSIEPRFMISKSIALVAFLDVGNVYLNPWPTWNDAFLKSLGTGIRYFSFIGPLRLDIGFPMNKRPNIRKDYQIYFSFGQAF